MTIDPYSLGENCDQPTLIILISYLNHPFRHCSPFVRFWWV